MTSRPLGPALLTAALLAATGAGAQSMDSTGGDFSAGWGRSLGQESRGVTLRAARDSNGNRVIVDGIIQTGEDQSSFERSDGNGSGAGYGGNTAIGNTLAVNVIGSWNTVIVDSTQINNGDVIAGDQRAPKGELNGGVDLND